MLLQLICPSCGEIHRYPIGDTAPAVERAVAAIAAKAKDGKLTPAMDALGCLAIDLARAMDTTADDRAMAAMAKELRACLVELEQRAGHDDTGDAVADRLSAPVVHPPPVRPANAGGQSRRGSGSPGPAVDALAAPSSRRGPGDRP